MVPLNSRGYNRGMATRIQGDSDQYSNFDAGKILPILEGMAGLDYSIPDDTFTVCDNMPE